MQSGFFTVTVVVAKPVNTPLVNGNHLKGQPTEPLGVPPPELLELLLELGFEELELELGFEELELELGFEELELELGFEELELEL